MTQPFLSVVIPAYNEEARIESTLEQIHTYLSLQAYPWEIVVADDGSIDGTAKLVAAMGNVAPRVRLLSLEHRGKGWAVQRGMLEARGTYRFLCDADLSMPVDHIGRFLGPAVEGADILVGSREMADSRRMGEPARRHWMGRVFNLIIRALVLPGIGDTQCGFKLFKAETTMALFQRQTLWGYAFDVEVLYLARLAGLAVREVAIDWHYREGSKVRPLRDAAAMARDVIKIRWRLRAEK